MDEGVRHDPQEVTVVAEVGGEKIVVGKGITWSDDQGIGITIELDPGMEEQFARHFLNQFSISEYKQGETENNG